MTHSNRRRTRLALAALMATIALPHIAAAQEAAAGKEPAAAESAADTDGLPNAPFTIRTSTASQTAFQPDPETGDMVMIGTPLSSLLAQGYGIHPRDIVAPGIDLSERFDVLLRPRLSGELSPQQMIMIGVPQALKLTVERKVREGPINRLRPAKDTPQLQPSTADAPSIKARENRLAVTQIQITELIAFLRWRSPRPVVDESGLEATYDFVLEWDESSGTGAVFHSLHDIGLEIFPDEGEFTVLQVTRTK